MFGIKKCFFRVLSRFLNQKIPLAVSIKHGKYDDVLYAIAEGYNLNYHTIYSKESFVFPLLESVFFRQYEICELLLSNNADPNYHYFHPQSKENSKILLYHDPEKRLSNEIKPEFADLDPSSFEEWYLITPTVLAYLLGDVNILKLMLAAGGKIVPFFNDKDFSFLKLFLDSDNLLTPQMCKVLVENNIFYLEETEMIEFQVFYRNFFEYAQIVNNENNDRNTKEIHEIFQILRMLVSYGFESSLMNGTLSSDDENVFFETVPCPEPFSHSQVKEHRSDRTFSEDVIDTLPPSGGLPRTITKRRSISTPETVSPVVFRKMNEGYFNCEDENNDPSHTNSKKIEEKEEDEKEEEEEENDEKLNDYVVTKKLSLLLKEMMERERRKSVCLGAGLSLQLTSSSDDGGRRIPQERNNYYHSKEFMYCKNEIKNQTRQESPSSMEELMSSVTQSPNRFCRPKSFHKKKDLRSSKKIVKNSINWRKMNSGKLKIPVVFKNPSYE